MESYARNAYTVLLVKNDKTTKPLYASAETLKSTVSAYLYGAN